MRIVDIVIKDLKIILSDRKATMILIAMPLILIAILGTALKGSFIQEGNENTIKISVVKKYDVSEETNRFIDFLGNSSIFKNVDKNDINNIETGIKDLNVDEVFTKDFLQNEEIKKILEYEVTDEETALRQLNSGEVSAVLVLPQDFIFNMSVNFFTPFRNKIEIKVIGHPDRYISSQIVEGIMTGFSDRISSIIIGKNVFLETALEEGIGVDEAYNNMESVIDDISDNLEELSADVAYVEVEGKKPITGFQYYAVGMATMFILFAAGNGGKLLLDEKKNITYQRMTIGGIQKGKIVFGKFFTVFLLSIIQTGLIIVFTSLIYKVKWGTPIYVTLITVCTAFSVAGLGMLLAAITFKNNNYKASDVYQAVIINGMSILGGSFIPIDILPKFFQSLSNFTLNGLALKSYLSVMQGGSIGTISSWLLGLIAIGIVLTLISVYILWDGKGGNHVKHNKNKIYKIEA